MRVLSGWRGYRSAATGAFLPCSRESFGPGDVLFVPARVVHRFENFTEDLTVWVIFYGPEKQ
jgi:hypothetical protein